MVVAKLAAMANDRSISGINCPAKATTARLGPGRSIGLALALSLILLCAAAPAKASPVTVFGTLPSSGPITNGIYITNVNLNPTFLRIDGPGYFVVRDPASGVLSATRFGPFFLDSDGYLTTLFGKRLQGYNNPSLTSIGDLRINFDPLQETNGIYTSFIEIQTNGLVVEMFSDSSSVVGGQVLLQNFQSPSALTAEGWRFYGWSATVGPLPQAVPPGTAGTGSLAIGTLEQLAPKLQLSRYAGPPQTFSQGVLVPTSVPTDFGIEGGGFFVLRRTNDNALFATRAGAFYLDGSGYLVHYSGLRLQGYTNSALTSIGDVQIDPTCSPSGSDPGAYVEDFGIDRYGVITEYLSDGTSSVRGQILLEDCSNPDLITRTNFDLYSLVTNTGLWSALAPPLTGNLGWLVDGSVELSQFDASLLAVRSNLNFFAQGFITATNVPSNLGIMGLGFFTVRDPVANTLCATRFGAFQLDALGHLRNHQWISSPGIYQRP